MLAESPCEKPSVAKPAVSAPVQPKRNFEEDNEDELGLRLKRAQLENLAAGVRFARSGKLTCWYCLSTATNQEVRGMLRDERLQKTIKEIDSSTTAEQVRVVHIVSLSLHKTYANAHAYCKKPEDESSEWTQCYRMQALDTAMLDPRFQEFCDKVLVTLNPEDNT
eukprot:1196386-Prorocentrum_minimum.AAC.6